MKTKTYFPLALFCALTFLLCGNSAASAQDKMTITCPEALSEVALITVVNDKAVTTPIGSGKCAKGGSLAFSYPGEYDWSSGYAIRARRSEYKGVHFYGALYKRYDTMKMPIAKYTLATLTPGTNRSDDLETSFYFLDDIVARIRNHRNPQR